MDDALKRATPLVERYGVPERMIAAASESLARMSKDQRLCLEANALGDAVLDIADAHGGPHLSCPSCAAIKNGVAVAMGILRAEVDLEFRERLGR